MTPASFQILSLDGGGMRGAYGAAFLAEIERLSNRGIAEHFDLIAGTSTGAIIATCLACGIPARDIERLFRERGPQIFAPSRSTSGIGLARVLAWLLRNRLPALAADPRSLLEARYQTSPLKDALVDVLGERVLEEMTTRLLVPAVDLVRGQTVVFKTPHYPGLVRDRQLRAVDVALASAAAPTYFPPYEMTRGVCYCDGGLWANNPAMAAYAEAVKIAGSARRPGIDPEFTVDSVSMLSIGTGSQPYTLCPPGQASGLAYWGPIIFDVMGSSQSQGVHFQAQYVLGQRYQRVDFSAHDRSWTLDRADVVEQLCHLGREAAIVAWSDLEGKFLVHRASRLTPFPISVERPG